MAAGDRGPRGGPGGDPQDRPSLSGGVDVREMDLDAVLARRPQVALVDELAHTNTPGSRNAKRWQDIEELRDAGIDVCSTVNIQHLAGLNDVIAQITGVVQRETVPDDVVRGADQIELVDIDPQALRQRLSAGKVYPSSRVDGGALATTSVREISPRCASWRCCGWPTRSTTNSPIIVRRTRSPTPGRPANESWWRSPAGRSHPPAASCESYRVAIERGTACRACGPGRRPE